jgi:TRAP transporter TAXI family solute receptor
MAMKRAFDRVQAKEFLIVAAPAILVVLGAFWLTFQFIEPAPPASIRMTTGGETGAYFRFATRYSEILNRAGIDLQVVSSKGSVENLSRLESEDSSFDVALMQGGIVNEQQAAKFLSVGRLFYEPLWVFHRIPRDVTTLTELQGMSIAVGPQGSGTRVLASKLLDANGIGEGLAKLLPLGGQDAIKALRAGEVQAIFLVAAPEAPMIQELLRDETIKLMSFSQAEAYTRIFPYLSRVVLPQGVVDLVRPLPSRDIELVAPAAALVVRANLHPALIDLLAQAALEVHKKPGLFSQVGAFPTADDPEFAVAEDARRVYTSGAPFLQRYLPFWLANFVERSFVLLVPILTVLVPLFQIVPWLYSMRVRGRILYWYGQLKKLEKAVAQTMTSQEVTDHRREIDRIDEAVNALPVPLPYVEQVYDLRGHIDLVRQRLQNRAAASATAAP